MREILILVTRALFVSASMIYSTLESAMANHEHSSMDRLHSSLPIEAIRKGEILAPITQIARLRDEAFARFWIAFPTQ